MRMTSIPEPKLSIFQHLDPFRLHKPIKYCHGYTCSRRNNNKSVKGFTEKDPFT